MIHEKQLIHNSQWQFVSIVHERRPFTRKRSSMTFHTSFFDDFSQQTTLQRPFTQDDFPMIFHTKQHSNDLSHWRIFQRPFTQKNHLTIFHTRPISCLSQKNDFSTTFRTSWHVLLVHRCTHISVASSRMHIRACKILPGIRVIFARLKKVAHTSSWRHGESAFARASQCIACKQFWMDVSFKVHTCSSTLLRHGVHVSFILSWEAPGCACTQKYAHIATSSTCKTTSLRNVSIVRALLQHPVAASCTCEI